MNVKELIEKIENEANRLENECLMLRRVAARVKAIGLNPQSHMEVHNFDTAEETVLNIKPIKTKGKNKRNGFVKRSPKKFTGLRDRIRFVLKSEAKGLKPLEVADKVVSSGYEHKGKTPLRQVISGELIRMYKGKQLQKTEGGEYTMLSN